MIGGLSGYGGGSVALYSGRAQAAQPQTGLPQTGLPRGGPQQEKPAQPGELTEEQKAQVAKLKAIDAKVRAHERAHAAVGGQYAGAPSYGYTRGPDGQAYATSGEVSIDVSAERDPEATLQKAAQVAAAALAPADPSGQDRAVAAAAAALRLEALAQIRAEKRAEQEAETGTGTVPPAASSGSPPPDSAARASQAYRQGYQQANAGLDRAVGSVVALSV